MATIDQQFVEYIVKTLVNNPDKVTVERTIDEKGVLLNLNVDEEDVGRIIGRRGATAQSIRTLLRALGTKNDARYNLKINNSEHLESDGHSDSSRHSDYSDHSDYSGHSDHSDATSRHSNTISRHSGRSEESLSEESLPEESSSDDSPISDLAEKTRADLADLDDLDI